MTKKTFYKIPSETVFYMLLHGARLGDEELVSIALRAGVNTNIKDREGKTALMLASGKNKKITKMLIEAKGKTNIDNKKNNRITSYLIKKSISLYKKITKRGSS